MFIKTESGIILNWDAISKVVVEEQSTHRMQGTSVVRSKQGYRVVAYLAHSNSPVLISSCDIKTAREIMDAIEDALTHSRAHPDLASIFAKRHLARELAKQRTNE